ncbi:MAG: ybeY [Planctomycetaceae bacterium]|nr:ybeY [Planctomycetaceae bacterium]
MYDIQINNEQQRLLIADANLKQIVSYVLTQEQVLAAEISVAVVDNPTIWRLNRRHLQHDYPTDVLSFLLDCQPENATAEESDQKIPRGVGKTISGEVIVSAEMACDMAAQYHWNGQDELCLYLVHGLLHLCGYDDLSAEEQTVMRLRERAILQHWNLVPHYADFPATVAAEEAS